MHPPPPSVRDDGRAVLVQEPARLEAREREGGRERMRLVARDGVGEDEARSGDRLEPAGPPAAVEVEARDGRLADDRTRIRADIDDAAPLAQHPEPAHDRE